MALDEIVADPLTFRVGYNSTVRATVKKLGEDFDISAARYSVEIRALARGATEYAMRKELTKVGSSAPAVAEGQLPAWAAADEGRTFKFLVVMVDSNTAPSGAATLSGDAEEVLGEFTRTIGPGLVGSP